MRTELTISFVDIDKPDRPLGGPAIRFNIGLQSVLWDQYSIFSSSLTASGETPAMAAM